LELDNRSNRRGFLGRFVAAAGALSLPATDLRAAPAIAQANPDAWINEVTGANRCLFDFSHHLNAVPLLHIHNYLGTYESAYSAGSSQVGAVGTLYGLGSGSSLVMGFDNFIWQKYGLGEYAGLRHANGQPYTTNVFNTPTEADGHLLSSAMNIPSMPVLGSLIVACSIPSLQKRGTKFLMCNNALGAWTFELEARGKGTQAAIDKDLRSHLLPGITIVPAMVIAIQKAQAAGMAYNKQ